MPSVLVVEDDQFSRDILGRLLRHNDVEVDIAINAEEALSFVQKNQYHLVIVDLSLPRIDGWELLKMLRENADTASLKSVAITGYYDPQVAQKARQAGFLACYPKPATQIIINEIKSYLV